MTDVADDDVPDDTNVVAFPMPDMKREAERNNAVNGLPPRSLTRNSDAGEASAWVGAASQYLSMILLPQEIEGWCEENARNLELLERNHPDEYETLCADLLAAQENAKFIRL